MIRRKGRAREEGGVSREGRQVRLDKLGGGGGGGVKQGVLNNIGV